ncbi:MAG: family 78 glycoside hydrolase catalytic domain [Clostridia bacterium]|nr:family 78 glycoside hydrolase catalytic domain [Clostridia bacterium]
MTATRRFFGKWITSGEFAELMPRPVFCRQLAPLALDCTEHRNRHVLFRRRFVLRGAEIAEGVRLFITADDTYRLYLNGRFVAEGPSPSYHFAYRYREIDVSGYLREGENTIAVHTHYMGLINRVLESGDRRHGLLLDLVAGDTPILASDEGFLVADHTAYREVGTVGYETGFLEEYDARAAEVGFEAENFDDSAWAHARVAKHADHILMPEENPPFTYERILPSATVQNGGRLLLDFGGMYVGRLTLTLRGRAGATVHIRHAQEIDAEGGARFQMRANCRYEEPLILKDGVTEYEHFDYTAFRYAELLLPEGCTLDGAAITARHYPFTLRTSLAPAYRGDTTLSAIFSLCERTLRYGVQEAVLDCMEREKGFYLGDGCYTALAHTVLTGDDAMIRKLIEDAFLATAIIDTMPTCLNCSFIQEIAEYPLMLVRLILWHWRLTGDSAYLSYNYPRVTALLDAYREHYERDGLLYDLDKWWVVEWPMPYRDGYDAELPAKEICHEPHVVGSAHYLAAVRAANRMAAALGLPAYRDEEPLTEAFLSAFYRKEEHLFFDRAASAHVSMIGNIIPFGLGLIPDGEFLENVLSMIDKRGITAVSLFGAFPLLEGLARTRDTARLRAALCDPGAWCRMLDEGATATFEGWGKDTKWNTSLFHLTMSYAAVFLSDLDLTSLFCEEDLL